jgi:hypothetical protein
MQCATRKGRRSEADRISKKSRTVAARDEEHVVSRAPLLLFDANARVHCRPLSDDRSGRPPAVTHDDIRASAVPTEATVSRSSVDGSEVVRLGSERGVSRHSWIWCQAAPHRPAQCPASSVFCGISGVDARRDRGFTLHVDRSSGKVMGTSYWESREAMDASAEAVTGPPGEGGVVGWRLGRAESSTRRVVLDTMAG